MNSSDSNPDYGQLTAALSLTGISISASEVHGIICGVICNQLKTGRVTDVCELILVGTDVERAKQTLCGPLLVLHTVTSTSLHEGEVGFTLLLPDDSHSLIQRTDALADWCHGFTVGLLHNGAITIDQLPTDSEEIARDIMDISGVEVDAENLERDEWALNEVQEYVRIGVQVIYEELLADAERHTPSHKIH